MQIFTQTIVSLAIALLLAFSDASQTSMAEESGTRYAKESPTAIWRDSDARDTAARLGAAHADPMLLLDLLACGVSRGTKLVILDGGFVSSTVMVIDGPNEGCRGVVENSSISSDAVAADKTKAEDDTLTPEQIESVAQLDAEREHCIVQYPNLPYKPGHAPPEGVGNAEIALYQNAYDKRAGELRTKAMTAEECSPEVVSKRIDSIFRK